LRFKSYHRYSTYLSCRLWYLVLFYSSITKN